MKKILTFWLFSGLLLLPVSAFAITNSDYIYTSKTGSNLVSVNSCEQMGSSIRVGLGKGAKYLLTSSIRDAGYGMRAYKMTCINKKSYRADWTEVIKKKPSTPVVTPKPTPAPTTNPISNSTWDGTVVFNGYGSATWNTSTQLLTLSPKASVQPNETHAALAISKTSFHQPFQLSYTMKTTQQLRTGSSPNAWEVGWTVFGYKDDGKFKYLILKPNGYGLELGESLLNDKQNFLFTSPFNQDQFPINKNYNVVINAKNNIITVTINDKQYAQYSISAKDVLNLDGKYGFYAEDASVQVSNIIMQQL